MIPPRLSLVRPKSRSMPPACAVAAARAKAHIEAKDEERLKESRGVDSTRGGDFREPLGVLGARAHVDASHRAASGPARLVGTRSDRDSFKRFLSAYRAPLGQALLLGWVFASAWWALSVTSPKTQLAASLVLLAGSLGFACWAVVKGGRARQ